MRLIAIALVTSCISLGFCPQPQEDLRSLYDVDTYRLDLKVDPDARTLSGTVGIAAKALKDIPTFELDLMDGRKVVRVNMVEKPITPDSSLGGPALAFTHENNRIRITLPKPIPEGQEARIAVTYELKADAAGGRQGIRFGKTPDGKPWITTSCQGLGAHSWWPQKGENEHPEDKFAHLFMNVTVPKGLTAVSNGRLIKVDSPSRPPPLVDSLTVPPPLTTQQGEGWRTFHWRHDYPCENYSVTLDVAPYVELKGTLNIKGIGKPLPYSYYVLPQDVEKAKLQFQDAPKLLEVYNEAFGPFPYPNSKFGLVQTDFWGMEHSTAVAYGNSFPAWIKVRGGEDKWASRNVWFDYILIHEVAHEWWGNAVSAQDWGHLWIHEGFATYAEAVYVEKTMGRDKADEYLATLRPSVLKQFREFRGTGVLPSQAFNNNVYYKGAWILNTLRYYVNDDKAWWKALREFNMRYRYKNANTEGFQMVLEEVTGKGWQPFFLQWFYGDGYPVLKGTVVAKAPGIVIDIDSSGTTDTRFDLPIDLTWTVGGKPMARRVMLEPGRNHVEIPSASAVANLKVVNLHRVLADSQILVASSAALR